MKSDDEEQYSSKSSLISIVTTVSKLKRKVLVERSFDVNDKMESNSAKLRKYTTFLSNSAEQWGHMSSKEEDNLTFRSQKVLCNLGSTDAGNDGKDDCPTVAPSIIFGSSSGGKVAPKPLKLFAQPSVPPYTTWIYLDRNQRMTEDQSVQGRRRIYYDPVGNETLIASDSEEEEPGDEVLKHDFSKGEDFIIWAAVQERGQSNIVFDQIAQCINVNVDEVQARFEVLLKDADKQATCEALAAGIRSKVSSPSGRRKGSKDLVRSFLTETQAGCQTESHVTATGSGLTRKADAEKAAEAKDLVAAMDSFDNLFCRRCLVFDCRLHGCSQPLVHPSERQPSVNVNSESVVPCGSHCYLSSQRGGAESSNNYASGMRASSGGVSSGSEGAERLRAAKRQKIQDSAVWWASQKVGSPNSDLEGTAELVANSTQLRSKLDSGARSVVNVEDKIRLDQSEAPTGVVPNDDFESRKRDQAPLGSRLTSHKKLARISRKRNVESGPVPSGLHKCQTQLAVIDLTDMDEKLCEKDTPGVDTNQIGEMNGNAEAVLAKAHHQTESNFIDLTSPDDKISQMEGARCDNELVEGMNGKAVDQAPSSGFPRSKHVSKKIFREDFAIVQQAGARFSSTKKLARNSKRALQDYETNLPSRIDIDRHRPDDTSTDHGQMCSNGKSGTNSFELTKSARTPETGAEEELVGGVPAVAVVPEDLEANIFQKAVDLDSEKYKVASPKKLARSARKPVALKVLGMVELKRPLPLENFKGSGKVAEELAKEELTVDEDRPLKGEKTRNSAAKKLARSARKAFAEKVAEAIQHQQLHSQVDVVNKLRGGREHAREEAFDASGIQQVKITADTVRVGGDQSQSKRMKPDKNFGVDNRQLVDKSRHILRTWKEIADDADDVKPDRALTRSGLAGDGAILNGEDDFKKFESKHNWTVLEIGLFEKGLEIFGKSSCAIAKSTLKGCKSCAEVGEYMKAREAAAMSGAGAGIQQLSDNLTCVLKWDVARARARFYGKRKGTRKLKFTLKSAGQSAIRKRMVNGKDAPCRQYTPCGCLFTCGKQCPCQLSGTCCEKYCGCAKGCKNRFRGCHCAKSQCCSRQCPCFAAGRECDPDVCRNCWIGCGDVKSAGSSQREDKDHYQCHNMKLLLKQQQRVLLSRSEVAGWGAFLKNTVSKHEYLGEYTGELISHREADKRGKIYDRENSSFLFNLNDQYVLDACRKGDKLKFANHSPNPNCYAKVIMVAGDHRVGIFAKERISAGEELFYDYRYEADRAPAWARRGEDGGNNRKDDNGPGERRSKHAS